MRFAAVLLAAGESRRMEGVNKLLVPVEGVPLVRRSAETLLASPLVELVVVLGFEAERVREALAGLDLTTVVNHAWAEGQMGSVRTGLAALGSDFDAVLVCLADQPRLTPQDIETIQRAFAEREPDRAVLVPRYRGERGNPIVIARERLIEILERDGNFGCRQFVARNPDLVATVEMDSDHVLVDLDRREDFEALGSP